MNKIEKIEIDVKNLDEYLKVSYNEKTLREKIC